MAKISKQTGHTAKSTKAAAARAAKTAAARAAKVAAAKSTKAAAARAAKVAAAKSTKAAAARAAKARFGVKVLGVTKDGVRILKPKVRSAHFTQKELRSAIASVRMRAARGA